MLLSRVKGKMTVRVQAFLVLEVFLIIFFAIVVGANNSHNQGHQGLRQHNRDRQTGEGPPLQAKGAQHGSPGLRQHHSDKQAVAGAIIQADSIEQYNSGLRQQAIAGAPLQADNNQTLRGKSWLLHLPAHFRDSSQLGNMRYESTASTMSFFHEMSSHHHAGATDGENRDALEHFFWGMTKGLALELGASEGTTRAGSMTKAFETMQWKRILIEGDPTCRDPLLKHNRESMIVSACICTNSTKVHYGKQGHVGGIIEFMSIPFLNVFYPELLNTTNPQGDWSTADWSVRGKSQGYDVVDCVPLREILSYVGVRHINFAVIDVEGGEFDVLRSVDWDAVVFDVLVVETSIAERPKNYAQDITEYLGARGYELVELQKGRNSWYRNKNYSPSSKPGLDVQKCWNGANRVPLFSTC